MANKSLNSSSMAVSTNEQCPNTAIMTGITFIIIVTGIIGNYLVIRFVRCDLKRRKTADKVFLLSLSFNNVLALLTSLPLQYFDVVYIGNVSMSLETSNTLCFMKLYLLFSAMCICITTLSILSYERYEAITKFPQQRLLCFRKAVYSVCITVVASFIVTFGVMSFYIVDLQYGKTLCEGLYIRGGFLESELNSYGNVGLIAQTATAITITNTLSFTWLFLVDYKLRNHLQSVRSTLGDQTTIKEVRIYRSAIAFVVTYSCVWTPFGAARGLRNSMPESPSLYCFYLTAFVISYSTFSIVPYLYMFFDKRIKSPFACLRS